MVRYSLIYGGIAGVIVIALIILTLVTGIGGHSVVLGYLVMLVVLGPLIFVAVKRYRDVEKGGTIRFGPALGLGLGIALVAALAYVLVWEGYEASTGYAFMDDYTAPLIAELEAEGGPDAARQLAEIEAMKESYSNPLYRMGLIFMEIFPVGLLVALVSAALLRNPRLLPAKS